MANNKRNLLRKICFKPEHIALIGILLAAFFYFYRSRGRVRRGRVFGSSNSDNLKELCYKAYNFRPQKCDSAGSNSWCSTCTDYVTQTTKESCKNCNGFFGNYRDACYYFGGPFKEESSGCYGKEYNSDGGCKDDPNAVKNWKSQKCH